jgi:hypothetical protein
MYMKAIKQIHIVILSVIMLLSQVSAIMHTHDFVLCNTKIEKIHIHGIEYPHDSASVLNHVHCALCDISYSPGFLIIHHNQTIFEFSFIQYPDTSPSQFYSFCNLQKQSRAPPYTA